MLSYEERTKKLKRLKAKQRMLKKQLKRLGDQEFTLECKIWDLAVSLVKPSEMCRRMWTSGYYCALKRGHTNCCQGQAPKPEYK